MARRTQKNVGVIGLGIIGRRVADCVRRAGFSTFVWNRTPRPFPNFVGSPAEIAELCDFIQIFVSDDEALLQVVQRMKQSLGSHHIILAHSTVSPATTRAAAEIVQRRGAQLLDAPFTGSKIAAEKGELVYYIGGDDAAYRRARPVLEASSKEIIEIGEIGQATTIKIATNMITAATVQAAAEALALVHSSGLPLEKFAEAMKGNGSNSGTLKMKLPKMLQGDFEPHFSVKHMLKDVEIASRLGRAYGLALPATEAARDSLLDESRQGRNNDDYSSIARVFFPHGTAGKMKREDENEDEQSVLAGLDEHPVAAAVAVEPKEESAARNGQAVAEISKEEIRRVEVISEKPAELLTEKREEIAEKKPEESIEAKREETIAEKIVEPEKGVEEFPDKPTEPEKREEPIEQKREEPIVAKVEEKIEEKREKPVEEKSPEPVVAKREETEAEKVETLMEEKRAVLVVEKREEPVAKKIEEPIAVKVEQPGEEKREEIPLKLEDPPKPIVAVEPAVATKLPKDEKVDEVVEPARRSFLSRLFGKTADY